MNGNVCLLCLKSFQRAQEGAAKWDQSLLSSFLQFSEKYLQLDSTKVGGGGGAFCKQCEIEVINPICKAYQELVNIQLRLQKELRKMGRLLENSQRSGSVSNSLKGTNLKLMLLTTQLGMDNVGHLQAFRDLLTEMCTLKGLEELPQVPDEDLDDALVPKVIELGFEPSQPVFELDHSSSDGREAEDDDEVKIEINAVSEDHHISVSAIDPLYFHPVAGAPPHNLNEKREECSELPRTPLLARRTEEEGRKKRRKQDFSQSIVERPNLKRKMELKRKPETKSTLQNDRKGSKCTSCQQVFPTVSGLLFHMNKFHSEHKCLQQNCKLTFKDKKDVVEHFKAKHNHPCPHCRDTFVSDGSLKIHIARKHRLLRIFL